MAGKGSAKGRDRGNVVIRREEVIEGGHHGGAWKVAYADFVTAMMAFFLLMWLLNATTEAQRKGIADYFTPNNILSRGSSGSGLPFGGKTPFDNGNLVSDRGTESMPPGHLQVEPQPADPRSGAQGIPPTGDAQGTGGLPQDATGTAHAAAAAAGPRAPGGGTAPRQAPVLGQTLGEAAHLANVGAGTNTPQGLRPVTRALDTAALRAELARREQTAFDQAAAQLRAAIAADPRLAELAGQLAIDQTPEGLRIQMLDAERRPMFPTGSAAPNEHARLLIEKVAQVLAHMPEQISIAGHTDAAPYKGGGKTNWELSAERANATRRMLVEAGVPQDHFRSVTGNADRDPLLPADPLAAANRRIAIVVLRAAPVVP